jgi:hypothetical protein
MQRTDRPESNRESNQDASRKAFPDRAHTHSHQFHLSPPCRGCGYTVHGFRGKHGSCVTQERKSKCDGAHGARPPRELASASRLWLERCSARTRHRRVLRSECIAEKRTLPECTSPFLRETRKNRRSRYHRWCGFYMATGTIPQADFENIYAEFATACRLSPEAPRATASEDFSRIRNVLKMDAAAVHAPDRAATAADGLSSTQCLRNALATARRAKTRFVR